MRNAGVDCSLLARFGQERTDHVEIRPRTARAVAFAGNG